MALTKDDLKAIENILDQKLKPIKGDIDQIKTDANHLKTDVNHLKTDVNHLKTDVAYLKTEVKAIRKDVNDLVVINQLDEIRKDGRLSKVFKIQA